MMKNRTIRNLIIFTLVVGSIGWIGAWVDKVAATPPGMGGTLGMLLFIIAPLATSLILRGFGGDGWKDVGLKPAFKGKLGFYAIALLFYPVAFGLALGLGALLGAVSWPGTQGMRTFFQLLGISLVGNFFKNIFEEFAWRGYLTPKVDSLGTRRFVGHLLVGGIWSLWQIPYWLFFIPTSVRTAYSPYSLPLFILFGIFSLLAAAVLYGELRLLTGSVWPAMILHTIANAVNLTLLMQGFVKINSSWEFLVVPGVEGQLVILLSVLTAVFLNRAAKPSASLNKQKAIGN